MNQEDQNNLVESWAQVLCDNHDIIALFRALEIKDLKNPKNIQTLSRTYSDDGRMIMDITAENTKGKTLQIIIDATSGMCTWGQFINATYDHGDSVDLRIILYDEDCRDEYHDIAGGIFEISNLVRRNNKCNVTTYFVKGIDCDSNDQKILHEYHVEQGPDDVSVDPDQAFPSKRQVQEAEFWAGYYESQWGGEPIEVDVDIIYCWTLEYSLRNNLMTEALWNDEGFFIKLIEKEASDAIFWIWNNKKGEFEEAYPNCDITFEKIDENRHAISVRLLNISMTDLINMSPEDKFYYGEFVMGYEHGFCTVAEDAVEDYNDSIKVAKAI